MSAFTLLSRFRKLNIRLWIENDELRYQAPPGVLTKELLSELTEKRTEVIAFLQRVNSYSPIEPAPEQEYYPVTPVQKRFYILNQIEGTTTSYNMSGAVTIEGKLDRDRLEEAFRKLVNRHEAFRTTFELIDGELFQRVHQGVELAVDYQEVEESRATAIIERFIRPFDVSRAPLLRINLVKVAEAKHILLYDMHHIISDSSSMGVLVQEFAKLYNGETLPELRIQYKDFALWQNDKGTATIQQQEKYWLEKFAGEIPVLDLPNDYPRAANTNFEGAAFDFLLNEDVTRRLKQLTIQKKATLFMTLLAGYNLLLSRLTGIGEITVGTTVAGRGHADLKNIIGMFVNTLALKNHLNPRETFSGFLEEVKQNSLQAFENQDYPFEMLLEKLKIPIDLSHNPLFNTLFNPQDVLEENYQFEVNGLRFTNRELNQKASTFGFDLMLKFNENGSSILFNCVYRTSLFKRSTIEYLMNEYTRLLEEIALNPGKPLGEYKVLDPKGIPSTRNMVSVQGPRPEFEAGAVNRSIVDRFEEQVRQYPGQIAAKVGSQTICYELLNKRANLLARVIMKESAASRPVALLFGSDLAMFTGILGVLKAGRAYLPLDPTYPTERLSYMLQDSGAGLIITGSANLTLAAEISQKAGKRIGVIDVDRIDPGVADDNLNLAIPPEQIAYIKYTSGSTGKPKGIPQTHRNVLAFIRRYTEELHINPGDKVALFSSYSHSAGGIDIFSMLLNGGTIYPFDLKSEGDMRKVADWLMAEGITIFHSVPTVYRYCTDTLREGERFGRVRLVVLGGESLSPQDLDRLRRYFEKDCILVNMFGATEVIIGTFNLANQETEITRAQVPIGYPVEEVKIYLINEQNQEAPVYGIGEIVYESEYLALDYLNLPEKSAAAYVPNPLTGTGRVFLSGDLGRRLPDGRIEFLGRKDFQVKIRGYRIELEEIEAALDQIPGIRKSVVAQFKKAEDEHYLAAYYLTSGENHPEPVELRRLLGRKLPEYMIPSYFISLERLPLTPSGKLDRKALPEPGISSIDIGVKYEAPRNHTETKLAEIWQEILGVKQVGIHDEFFVLGGDSLKALKTITAAVQQNIQISINDIFRHQTIAKIIENIEHSQEKLLSLPVANNGETPTDPPIIRVKDIWSSDTDYQVDNPEVKELKIKIQRDINVYIHRALPLCIVLADPNLYPWYYEHFINIFAHTEHDGRILLDFLENYAPYRDAIGEISLGKDLMEKETDIIRFIIEKINQGYYLNIAVDEYYLPGKEKYQKIHFIHHELVYGYDNFEKKVKALGFIEGGIFDESTFTYNAFAESYEQGKLYYRESAPWTFRTAVQLFYSYGYNAPHPFNIHKFLTELHNYLSATGDEETIYYWRQNKAQVSYGFNVYDVIITHLNNVLNGNFTIDYRAFHLLYEQKKAIAKRLDYIITQFKLSGKVLARYEEYLLFAAGFNELRLKLFNLQHKVISSDGGVDFTELKKVIQPIIEKLNTVKEKERQILWDIYRIFTSRFGNH